MRHRDAFSAYHPLVNLGFFVIVLGCATVTMHPVCLLISLMSGAGYYLRLKGRRAAALLLRGVLPLILFTAAINPLFSHGGDTVLMYFPSGGALTLESILYGIAAGTMLGAVLLWFACFSEVMTTDKFLYLFGKMIPSLSLLLSMTLRFVPRFRAQFTTVRQVQATLGRSSGGGFVRRIRDAVTCFGAVVAWSMENAIETADSMKSRGYGTRRRTTYTVYRLTGRDTAALAFLGLVGFFLLAVGLAGGWQWKYFPAIGGALAHPLTLVSQAAYLLLCLAPVLLDRGEEAAWKRSASSI